jgi:hypothetical protein
MMSSVVRELEHTLSQLDAQSAHLLERLVRDALSLARQKNGAKPSGPVDANGWPVGHFEKFAGILAGDDWEPSPDPPPEPTPEW